jgi:hypothetical protein
MGSPSDGGFQFGQGERVGDISRAAMVCIVLEKWGGWMIQCWASGQHQFAFENTMGLTLGIG